MDLNARRRRDNLDVLELSLPDRQCRFSWQPPSSFYFIKRTKTAARTSRAIYTACRRVCLRAKSCSGQEMRRAMLLSSLFLTWRFLHFLPFLCQDRIRHSRKLRSIIRNFPFVSWEDSHETNSAWRVTSASFKFLWFLSFYIVETANFCYSDCECTFEFRVEDIFRLVEEYIFHAEEEK